MRSEIELKNRNELTIKTIANLKSDIDSLKTSVTEKNIEYQELKGDNKLIKDIAEHKLLDISKLKNELVSSLDFNSKILDDKRTLETQVISL